jgi:hypothetical protein
MERRHEVVLRLSVITAMLLLTALVFGQTRFTVNGRVKIEGADLSGARAVVMKNGVKERTITTNLNKFSLELDINADYIISFEKEGYVSKKLSFNTHAPGEAIAKGFTPFDFAVSLFRQYDDVNIVVFNQPVGVIRYEPSMADFDYDTDYSKSIQKQLDEAQTAVEKHERDDAKRADADVKARAKAEAEAKKAAEAQARAEAEARKQAEAAAKAEADAATKAEAKAKADAEAQRALEARQAAVTEQQEAARKQAEENARAAEQRKQAEAERAAAQQQRKAEQATKPVPPPPAVVERPTPPPPREMREPPRTPAPTRNLTAAEVHESRDLRRAIGPVIVEEASRMAAARVNKAVEPVPGAVEEEVPVVVRNEELVVEPTRVMTIIRLESAGVTTEYRKVTHKWGTTFYFRNGEPCTQLIFDSEARSEQLAGATPSRSKHE